MPMAQISKRTSKLESQERQEDSSNPLSDLDDDDEDRKLGTIKLLIDDK